MTNALSKRSFAVRTWDRRLGAFDGTTPEVDRANPLFSSLGVLKRCKVAYLAEIRRNLPISCNKSPRFRRHLALAERV